MTLAAEVFKEGGVSNTTGEEKSRTRIEDKGNCFGKRSLRSKRVASGGGKGKTSTSKPLKEGRARGNL